MFIRQSALTASAALSARSRSTTASRSATSWALVRCDVSHPFFCQSVKLMITSDDEHFRLVQRGRQEMMAGTNLFNELAHWIDRRIHIAPKTLLSLSKGRCDVSE